MKKMLAITNNVSKTGAPILLLHLLQILKENGWKVNTLVRRKSIPLAKEFQHVSDVFGFYPDHRPKPLKKLLKSRIKSFLRPFRLSQFLNGVEVVLNNTITNGEVLEKIRRTYSGPIISYIHELESFGLNDKHAEKVIKFSDLFIVPCHAVKRFLVRSFAIQENRIYTLNYYIPQHISTNSIAGFKSSNKLSASFIVGAAGTLDWRKGCDLFIQLASSFFYNNANADVQFVWMGADKKKEEYNRLKFDIDKLGLSDKVILVEASDKIDLFFKSIDVFLLTSREDPYPLVVLEAAAAKVPAICFNNAGGIPEFIEDDAGITVEYCNLQDMESAMNIYINNRSLLKLHGQNAFEKVKRLHQDKNLIHRQFSTIVHSVKSSS